MKRCVRIEMLYVTGGDIFYLHLILLKRKARSDRDVLTYNPVRGGGKPINATVTNNPQLHMVMLKVFMMYVRLTMICALMVQDLSAEATLLC